MATWASRREGQQDGFGGGVAGAVALHTAVAVALVSAAFLTQSKHERWGDQVSSVGAIQASMVSAIPLPPKAPPVKESVLTSEDVSRVPPPPPREAATPPPRPTDVLVKAKTPEKAPVKPVVKPTTAPPPKTITKPQPTAAPSVAKRPQPAPDTPKASSGETAATQLPQSVSQAKNGTAAATIEDRAFGARYAYYRDIVSRTVSQNWYTNEADPRASQGRRVLVTMEIARDGAPTNIHLDTRSGSPSLDTSALRALQRIETFGPLPAGDHITVQLSFDYHQP